MKIHPFQIPKPLHKNLILQEDIAPIFYNKLHQHQEIQLSLILRGEGKLFIGDSVHSFTKGDFFAIASHSPHLFSNEKSGHDAHMLSLFFNKGTFGDGFFKLSDLEEIYPFFDSVQESFQLMSDHQSVKKILLQIKKSNKLERFIYFLRLLQKLNTYEKKNLTNFSYTKHTSTSEGERMKTAYDFVKNNFQNKITLRAISDLVYMTPNAFCKFFKQRTNKTFFEFLIELRIEHACQLLQKADGTTSILEISEKSGFTSISNFNRQFKRLKGTIPSHYKNGRSIEERG